LVQRGLPHPSECPLCDQEDEDIQHLLIGCVFARQFWYSLLHRVGLSILTPQATELSWEDWWMKAEAAVDGDRGKGLNTLITLGGWTIWRHRNDCVFNGATSRLDTALLLTKEEAELWCLAGAKGLSLLTARGVS